MTQAWKRRTVLALTAFALTTTACGPEPALPAPREPALAVDVRFASPPANPVGGVVALQGTAIGFPEGAFSPNYDVTWTLTDVNTNTVLAQEGPSPGNGDGVFDRYVDTGLFVPTIDGDTATINVRLEMSATRGGETVEAATTKTVSWAFDNAPHSGSFETFNYSGAAHSPSFCTPVGSTVSVTLSGEISNTAGGFFRPLVVPYGSNWVQSLPKPGNTAGFTVVTTTPCWNVAVARASFAGGLSGITNYTVTWAPPLAVG